MNHKTAEEFIKQADLEIERGDWHGSWKIAVEGLKHFPDHAELQKYEHILAPPKVTSVDRGGHPEIRADREWMQKNRAEYRGRWVGIKNGQLLAVGNNHDEIIAQVGPIKNTGILVTVIY
jgi:hypothetical protein